MRPMTFAVMSVSYFLASFVSPCLAQWPINSQSTAVWTYRAQQNRATVFKISDTNGKLTGRFAFYKFNPASSLFERKSIQIGTSSLNVVDCTLKPIVGCYEIHSVATDNQPSKLLGWIRRFGESNVSQIRWKNDAITFDSTPIVNPCDAPPVDDVGEEELVANGPDSTTLTLNPGPRPVPGGPTAPAP